MYENSRGMNAINSVGCRQRLSLFRIQVREILLGLTKIRGSRRSFFRYLGGECPKHLKDDKGATFLFFSVSLFCLGQRRLIYFH